MNPDLVEIVQAAGVALRRQGKEFTGLCPFHADKHPSFAVNPDKQVWFCHACSEGGDLIRFIEKFHGVTFKEALAILGIDGGKRPPCSTALDAKARELASWVNEQTARAEYLLRKLGQKITLAQQCGDAAVLDSFEREWSVLETIAEDLQHEAHAVEMYESREAVESVLAEGVVEPWPDFPPLTPEYRAFLRSLPYPEVR